MHTVLDQGPFEMLTRSLPRDGEHLFVDAGANRGDVAAQIREAFPNATIAAFEPLPGPFAVLADRFAGDPRVLPVRAALSDRDGPAEFHATANDRFSSLFAPGGDLGADTHGATSVTEIVPIETMRLDTWFAASGLASSGFDRVDVVKADVQGAELAVLEGAGGLLDGTHAAFAEAQIAPAYDGAATFADIDRLLRDRGFACHQIHTVVTRGLDQHTESVDALWLSAEALRITREAPLIDLMPGPARRLVTLLERCRDAGQRRVAVMPAGTHTASLAPWFASVGGVEIVAAIDDEPGKTGTDHAGLPVRDRTGLDGADALILCSDSYESRIYDAIGDLRSRLPVHRLYADTE